jgi:hypothetical protein
MNDAREKAEAVARRLGEKREEHLERPFPYRVIWVIAALIVIAAGLAMLVLPGPAVIVIPIGLAMLSLEFAWAARLSGAALRRGAAAEELVERAVPDRRLRWAAIALAAAAVVALAVAVLA